MGEKTAISWTDSSWNPVRGCSRISAGCTNCYAERVAARFSGRDQPYEGLAVMKGGKPHWTGNVELVPEHLEDPLRWQKPRRIFVNSMSDLFHEKLDDETIDMILAVMLLAPRHTFQVLTKRSDRMRRYFTDRSLYARVLAAAGRIRDVRPELSQVGIANPSSAPASWIWLGVSTEDQDAADHRIPDLLATPAAVRFISAEPLIGPVDLRRHGADWLKPSLRVGYRSEHDINAINWVIAGCESGPGARLSRADWILSLRDQCESAGVAFFAKQARSLGTTVWAGDGSKVKGGGVIERPYLHDRQHLEFPS